MFEQHARSLTLKNNSLEDLMDGQRAMIELLVESEAKALSNEYDLEVPVDPERIPRLQHAIKEFATLIQRGAELHPALSAPEQVKNLFPCSQNPLAIESRIARISDSQPHSD